MRPLSEIHEELQALTERRTLLWRELSATAHDSVSAEIEELSAAIDALWDEARRTRSSIRFGSPGAIIARARAAERFEREHASVA